MPLINLERFVKVYSMSIEDLMQNKLIKATVVKARSNYQQTSNKVANILAELKTLLDKCLSS
jgi:hypothetical protein